MIAPSDFSSSGGKLQNAEFETGLGRFSSRGYRWYNYQENVINGLKQARQKALNKQVTCLGNQTVFEFCLSPNQKFYFVKSDYRNPAHNEKVPDASGSSNHQYGNAVDLASHLQRWEELYPTKRTKNTAFCRAKALERWLLNNGGAQTGKGKNGDTYSNCNQNKVHAAWPQN